MTNDTAAPAADNVFARFAGTALSPDEVEEITGFVRESAPGIDDDTATRVLYLSLGAISAHGDTASGQSAVQDIIKKAAAAKEQWAVQYLDAAMARMIEQYRPTFDKAVQLGMSPANALRLTHDLDEDTAREAVKYLKKTSTTA